jgi:hypothetical protein
MLFADEHSVTVVYYVEEDLLAPEWADRLIEAESADNLDALCAVVSFARVHAHMFGPPNDEAFGGHPLAARGLTPYGAFEVVNSSWLRVLEKMNSVHPYHRPEHFDAHKHFILSFHDSTFECIAQSFDVVLKRGSVQRVLFKSLADSTD